MSERVDAPPVMEECRLKAWRAALCVLMVVLFDLIGHGHRVDPSVRQHASRGGHGSHPPDKDPGRRIARRPSSDVPGMSS